MPSGRMWVRPFWRARIPKKRGYAQESEVAVAVQQLLNEGRIDRVRKKYSNIPQVDWQHLVSEQPQNSNNKYLAWCAKQVASGENTVEVVQLARDFDKLDSGKDINSLSFEQVKALVDERKMAPKSKSALRKEYNEVVYENEFWKVYKPETHEAMMQVGGGTHWCVATSNPGHWDNYFSRGAFLVFKAKVALVNGEPASKLDDVEYQHDPRYSGDREYFDIEEGDRFALYSTGYGSIEVYDKDDHRMSLKNFYEIMGKSAQAEDVNGDDIPYFIQEWTRDVESELEHKREEAETKALQEYVDDPDGGPHDFVEHYVEEVWGGEMEYDHRTFRSEWAKLSADEQQTIESAAYRSSNAYETDAYGNPYGTIDRDNFKEFVEYELPSAEERNELERLVMILSGYGALRQAVPDEGNKHKTLRQKYRDIDGILDAAASRIRAKEKEMKNEPGFDFGPESPKPSPRDEINKAALKRELEVSGYPDIAAALENRSISDQADALLIEAISFYPRQETPEEYVAVDEKGGVVETFKSVVAALMWQMRHPHTTVMPKTEYDAGYVNDAVTEARKHPDYVYRNADDSARGKVEPRVGAEAETSRIRRWRIQWDAYVFFRDGRPMLHAASEGELFQSKREAKAWLEQSMGPIRAFNPGGEISTGWPAPERPD